MAKKSTTAHSAVPQIPNPKPIEVDQERPVFQYTKGVTDWANRYGPQSMEFVCRQAEKDDAERKTAAVKLKWTAAAVADLIDAWVFAEDECDDLVLHTDTVSKNSMHLALAEFLRIAVGQVEMHEGLYQETIEELVRMKKEGEDQGTQKAQR